MPSELMKYRQQKRRDAKINAKIQKLQKQMSIVRSMLPPQTKPLENMMEAVQSFLKEHEHDIDNQPVMGFLLTYLYYRASTLRVKEHLKHLLYLSENADWDNMDDAKEKEVLDVLETHLPLIITSVNKQLSVLERIVEVLQQSPILAAMIVPWEKAIFSQFGDEME